MNMRELREAFVKAEVPRRLGLDRDPTVFLAVSQPENDQWWWVWFERIAEKALGEVPVSELLTTIRYFTPVKAVDSGLRGAAERLAANAVGVGYPAFVLKDDGFLVVFDWPSAQKPEGVYVVITNETLDRELDAKLFMEVILVAWVKLGNMAAGEYAFWVLRQLIESIREEAGRDFDRACAVSDDGTRICIADHVVVVPYSQPARVFPAVIFQEQKVIRVCNQQRWSSVTVQSLIPAVHQVAVQQIPSAFVSAVTMASRATLHDSAGTPVTGTLTSPEADYLVVPGELLRGPIPKGGVLLSDYLVSLMRPD